MNILIVGGSGFIGNHLTKKVHDLNYNYLSTYRKKKPKKFNFQQLDLTKLGRKKKLISKFKPNIVFYLSWNGIPDYSKKNSEHNLFISKKFIDFISKLDSVKRIIVSGSCFEKKKDSNLKHFVKAKLELKNYIHKKLKNKKVKLIWIRIFYVYGMGQRKLSLIPTLIRKLKKNVNPKIKNLNSSNDFIYIKDVIDFLIKCITLKTRKNILDCGYGKLFSVNEISLITEKLILKRNKYFKLSKEKLIKKGIKANAYNWFKPRYNLHKSIGEMVKLQKLII